MAFLKGLVEIVILIPQFFKLVSNLILAIKTAQAHLKYQTSKKENEEVTKEIEAIETKEQAQAAVDKAAAKWGKRKNKP
jgi:uncharacterized membrane protein